MGWFRKSDTTEHGYVEERLSAYLDGELSSQERAAVDRHLAICRSCQWNLNTLRQTVQWTRELPAVSVPRVFTIPASAAPARKTRRGWGFVPLLQGATALVALLLVFVVAGDFLLIGSMRPGSAPEPQMLVMEAPVESQAVEREERASATGPQAAEVEVTVAVELEKEAAAPAEPEAEKVVETIAVEAEPSQPPAPPPAPTLEKAEAEEATYVVEATASSEADMAAAEAPAVEGQETAAGAGGIGLRATPTLTLTLTSTHFFTFTTPGPQPTRFLSAVRTAVPTIVALATAVVQPPPTTAIRPSAAEPTETLTPLLPTATPVEPTPTTAPTLAPTATPLPTPVPQVAPPPLVAEVPPADASEAGARNAADERGESYGPLSTPGVEARDVAWLRAIELTLGIVFILLAATTIVVMVRRRRAG